MADKRIPKAALAKAVRKLATWGPVPGQLALIDTAALIEPAVRVDESSVHTEVAA